MDSKLTRQDWLDCGLRTLATEGTTALKVGAMAAALGASRGSFYWHFRDFADFRSRLLQTWRDRTVDQVIQEFEREPGGGDRFRRLMKRAFFGRRGLDRAIRIWAADEPEVAAMVAVVDSRRVAYLAEMLASAGVDPDQARARAAFVYWAYLGQAIVMDPASAVIDKAEMDSIANLFENEAR